MHGAEEGWWPVLSLDLLPGATTTITDDGELLVCFYQLQEDHSGGPLPETIGTAEGRTALGRERRPTLLLYFLWAA